MEFLGELQGRALPHLSEVRFITEVFCSTRYGHHALSAMEEAEIEKAEAKPLEPWLAKIDGVVRVKGGKGLRAGDVATVRVTAAGDHDLEAVSA